MKISYGAVRLLVSNAQCIKANEFLAALNWQDQDEDRAVLEWDDDSGHKTMEFEPSQKFEYNETTGCLSTYDQDDTLVQVIWLYSVTPLKITE